MDSNLVFLFRGDAVERSSSGGIAVRTLKMMSFHGIVKHYTSKLKSMSTEYEDKVVI